MREISDTVAELIKGVELKRKECERNGGHIAPKKVGYILTTRIDPLKDRVTILCAHCGTIYERSFNSKEGKEPYRFHTSLRESVITI